MLYSKLSSYSNILWDWNGTLINDEMVSNKILKIQLKKHNLELPHQDSLREIFCFPIEEFYRKLGFNFTEVSFEQLNKEYAHLYTKYASQAKLYPNTHQLLQRLTNNKIKLFVISAAEKNTLQSSLHTHNISKYFTAVYGLNDTKGKCKKNIATQLMQDHLLDPKETLMIGDTDHDLQVGNHIGVDVLLIAEGYQSYKKLSYLHDNVLEKRL
jgi:phosphoglycolate phosphatase